VCGGVRSLQECLLFQVHESVGLGLQFKIKVLENYFAFKVLDIKILGLLFSRTALLAELYSSKRMS
jgi:hypothetical protein